MYYFFHNTEPEACRKSVQLISLIIFEGHMLRRLCSSRSFLTQTAVRSSNHAAVSQIPRSEVTLRVLNVVKAFEKVDPLKVTENSLFNRDLGIDSLDAVSLILALEDEFVVEISDIAVRLLFCPSPLFSLWA